jgi:hypothetical protein
MSDKYHAMVWIEVELDEPLDALHTLARVGNAIRTIGGADTVNVACQRIRKDHAR